MEENLTIDQNINETLEFNYMPYAMSVIVSRAIPEIDGFKPSHRKLLYMMYKMKLLSGNKTKSANVVGQTMKLNPHGDMAIYEALVRLTRGNEALLHPYIDSKGSFGKQYSRDMAFAAPRYTEVMLDKLAKELFDDIEKETVDFIDNYDGTMREPVLLPTTFPNILTNTNQGIAVGMASNIASFNLIEICGATIRLLKNPKANIRGKILGPDFPTGGDVLYSPELMKNIIEKGRGTFKIRGKYRYDKKNSIVEIYEIPYTTTIEAIIDSIVDQVKSNKIREITDIRDETDLKGLKIAIEVKKSTDVDLLMKKLYKVTPLEDSFGCNFNILINGKPRVLGIRDILKEWIKFRLHCVKRKIEYILRQKGNRLHLLEGLSKILLDIDKAIKIIRNTEQERDVVSNLMKGFGIDKIQAEFIAEIKLRNLNKEYIINKTDEIDDLIDDISRLRVDLASEGRLKEIISIELKGIMKKYGKSRSTGIIHADEVETVTDEHFIEDYNLKLFLTNHNYLKKVSLVSLRASADHKLKMEDEIIQEIETHNKAELVLFSNRSRVYKVKAHEVPDCKASQLGEYLTNMLELSEGEEIIYMVATDDYAGQMLFSFESGKVAKVELEAYKTKSNRKKLANAYSAKSKLIDIRHITEDMKLVAISSKNKALIFNTKSVVAKAARNTIGVAVLKIGKTSHMKRVLTLKEFSPKKENIYRTKNIPAVGGSIKECDSLNRQLNILGDQ